MKSRVKIVAKGHMSGGGGMGKKTPAKSVDGGMSVASRHRFSKASDLKERYGRSRAARGSMASWQNILRQYERFPYKDHQGNPKSNFGQLRYKVDQALTTFVDFATERETWSKIQTLEGHEENQSKQWSEHITAAFQKFCISCWSKRSYEIMSSAKDMLLFNNGVLLWEGDEEVYPCSTPTETVWPDRGAGQFSDGWDVLFVEKSFTAVELFMKVEDEEVAEANGWRKGPVMRILKSSNDSFKDDTTQRLFDAFRHGDLSAAEEDFEIDVVIAFVKEYHEVDGKRISKYVFTRANIPKEKGSRSGGKVKGDEPETEYLLEHQNAYGSMSEVVATLNQTISRNYYDNTSFAQLVYTTCKQYDISMNRILEAIEDNMRVFLKSDSPEQLKKLQAMKWSTYQVLDPETTLIQERIQRPVRDAADVMRMVMIDQNVGTGQYQVGQPNQTGGPKTATQSEIDLSESTKISLAHLKLFNLFMGITMVEIYRRFVTLKEGKNYKRFKKYLDSRDVPASAYSPDNVCVESVISLGAGSPAAKLQAGKTILGALASPARTPGERQAKRDIISAVVGVENADSYLPSEEELRVPEDSLIGLENESLMNVMANPQNIPVIPEQLHLRHIPSHLQSMGHLMSIAESLFKNRGQLNPEDDGVVLATIGDALIGIDNIGSHAVAHIQQASGSPNPEVKQQLQEFSQGLQEINRRQDQLEQVVGEVQAKRQQEGMERTGQDPEMNHKQRMYALEEEHTAKMLGFDEQKAVGKAEQLREQSARNSDLKNQLKVHEAAADSAARSIKTSAEIQNDRIKAIAKANETRTNTRNGN